MSNKDKTKQDMEQREEIDNSSRSRPKRKTKYERISNITIPDEVARVFDKDGWSLALKRYRLNGLVQDSHIASKVREGWEFVTVRELPDWYRDFFDEESFKGRDSCVVIQDMVLMKADKELVADRNRYYQEVARNELEAVNINVLEKKGFKDLGTKSSVTMTEPRFK